MTLCVRVCVCVCVCVCDQLPTFWAHGRKLEALSRVFAGFNRFVCIELGSPIA